MLNRSSAFLLGCTCALFGFGAVHAAQRTPPNVAAPGDAYQLPARPTAPGAPTVFASSDEAGPDETFFLVGENLAANLSAWGLSADNVGGREWKPRVQFMDKGYLAATLPERAPDGVFLCWLKNDKGWSEPLVLNAPQPWWCGPDRASPGGSVRVFGRNLSRRPDCARAFVYLCPPGKPGVWMPVVSAHKFDVTFRVPENTAAGDYEIWLHAGSGGEFGWGGPLTLKVFNAANAGPSIAAKADSKGDDIQQALNDLSTHGGGTLKLPTGIVSCSTTLTVPAHVTLSGAGRDVTTLQLVHDAAASLPRVKGSGWNQAPGAVHTIGDFMEYSLDVPQAGERAVWLRYATDMRPWKQAGVSGNHTLALDGGAPVPLMNLDNTGGFGDFKWSRAATMQLPAGRHTLRWSNVKGGGVSLDAFVFALDPAFVPQQSPLPVSGAGVLVLQGEDCTRFVSKEGNLPGGDHAALWLSGDGARVQDLTVLGTAQVNYGIAIAAPPSADVGVGTPWLHDCAAERIRVADCDGKQGENCGAYVSHVERATIRDCELCGRAPLFIAGARRCEFRRNRLVSVTRFGGNAEAAILGRTEAIERCLIEDNAIAAPPGAEAGGGTARRLLWFSTGHGSVSQNWIAGNGVERPVGLGAEVGAGQARFGGVAGTDQNVGEMILFEGNHRTAYFGALAAADAQSVTLPKTIPPTPDNRLGNVERKQLAHDAAGNETPFWPPDADDGSPEPPMNEYYVTIFSGRGQGQTRRVVRRGGERLTLERPWAVAPEAGGIVAVGTMFHQNLIVGNYAPDGMTGIQLWISCVENVIAGNTIARQRKPGLFLYANGTTLASSMPRTWNRGISPLFWNVCEGNRTDECSAGALVTSGNDPKLPVEFPRALGNTLRHNSFIRSRADGVTLSARAAPAGVVDTSPAIVGTIVEFNLVRDAQVGYRSGSSSDDVVLRRNHAYFWYPVSASTEPAVGFQVDETHATVSLELNSVEGLHGVLDTRTKEVKKPDDAKHKP